jgi:integrase
MPRWAKIAIDQWAQAAGLFSGRILHSINKGDRLTHAGMTPQSIFMTVQNYARELGIQAAPHDLRRSFAKLAYKGRAALEQIQLSLGHATIHHRTLPGRPPGPQGCPLRSPRPRSQ